MLARWKEIFDQLIEARKLHAEAIAKGESPGVIEVLAADVADLERESEKALEDAQQALNVARAEGRPLDPLSKI
jgi:hypothetical protein